MINGEDEQIFFDENGEEDAMALTLYNRYKEKAGPNRVEVSKNESGYRIYITKDFSEAFVTETRILQGFITDLAGNECWVGELLRY